MEGIGAGGVGAGSRPIVSIIIVNWNGWRVLEPCLRSLGCGGVDQRDMEIIVVDNASSDGSVGKVKAAFPHVRIIENEQNLGFAAANNQALLVAGGEHLILLNPDTEVRTGAIRKLIDVLESRPEIGACGPLLVSPDGGFQVASARRLPNTWTCAYRVSGIDRFGHRVYLPFSGYGDLSIQREVEAISGACLAMRRDAYVRVGLLDELLPMGGEDIDYCFRIRESGFRLLFVPESVIMHIGGTSRALAISRTDVEGFKAIYEYFRKHGHWRRALVYRAMLAATMGGRAVLWSTMRVVNVGDEQALRQKSEASRLLLRWSLRGAGRPSPGVVALPR